MIAHNFPVLVHLRTDAGREALFSGFEHARDSVRADDLRGVRVRLSVWTLGQGPVTSYPAAGLAEAWLLWFESAAPGVPFERVAARWIGQAGAGQAGRREPAGLGCGGLAGALELERSGGSVGGRLGIPTPKKDNFVRQGVEA